MNHYYSKEITAISCITGNRSIGNNNKLIYSIKKELDNFKKITLNTNSPLLKNAVVMGRKTFESLPRILPGRLNCIITSVENDQNPSNPVENGLFFTNIEECLDNLHNNTTIDKIFIIGGEKIYKHCFDHNYFTKLVLTVIDNCS